MTDNGRVSTREFLEARLDALERMVVARFDALEKKLEQQQAHCAGTFSDHETRVRSLEKKSVWSNVTDAVLAVGSAIAGFIGART